MRSQLFFRSATVVLVFAFIASTALSAPINNPTDIAGNVLWLDGDDPDGNGVSGGSFVGGTNWVDKSTDPNQADMIIGAGAPSTIAGGAPFNGRNVVQFNGTSDRMTNGATNYTARSAFIVFNVDSTRQQNTDLGQLWGHYTTGVQVAVEARAGSFQNGFSFNGASTTTATYAMDGNSFVGPFQDSNTQPWQYDITHMISTEFTADQTLLAHDIANLNSIAGHQFGGQIGEIVVFDRVLTDGSLSEFDNELNDVQFYLQEKWGLNLGLSATAVMPVPEPSSVVLLGLGCLVFARTRNRRRSTSQV